MRPMARVLTVITESVVITEHREGWQCPPYEPDATLRSSRGFGYCLAATPAQRAAGRLASSSLAGRHFEAWTRPGSTRSSRAKNLATASWLRKVTLSAIVVFRPEATLA